MNLLICGLGSIGLRHAQLLQEHYPQYSLFCLRTHKGQLNSSLGIQELTSWEEVDAHSFSIAFITNPTHLHLETALACAKRNMHLFIEKPLDASTAHLASLLNLIEEKKLCAYLAYPLRHHPLISQVKKKLNGQKILHARMVCSSYLPSWRPGQDHLKSYSSFKNMGGGVVLDLSHEIDLASELFGEIQTIEGKCGRLSQITVDSEDYADLILNHAETITNVHLNYFGRLPKRTLTLETAEFSLEANLLENNLQISNSKGTENILCTKDDMFKSQLEFFFENLNSSSMKDQFARDCRLFQKIIEFKNRS